MNRITVETDKQAGFCWGVVRAIDFAGQELGKGERLFSLGDIIHNAAEVKRLAELGLSTITVDDLDKIPAGSRVLIRAHGEPPSTYRKALENGIELIDCPVVTKVQERIRKFVNRDFQVVIFGKKDHAEVIGLQGVTGGRAIVVHDENEALEGVDFSRPTVLFSQTTMDKETFYRIAEVLKNKIAEFEIGSIEETAIEFHAKDTICGQVSGREKKLREFARNHDVVIFTAGRKSSNGKVLYNIAQEENSRTHFIEAVSEIEWNWFEGAATVGITGATSTPQWAMEEVKSAIDVKFA
jgi:4-hydroxy-3-methylbut-2-enyl diphosphate reductase